MALCQAAIKTADSYHALGLRPEGVGGLKSFMEIGVVTVAGDPELLDKEPDNVRRCIPNPSLYWAGPGGKGWRRRCKMGRRTPFANKMKLVKS